jgi:hypothetical protein
MVYTFNGLPSGMYQVTLYFAECFWTAAGKRVFNVAMQNNAVISNVDIFAAVGENVAYRLVAQSISVPTTGTLTISFQPITGKDVPIIDAIRCTSARRYSALDRYGESCGIDSLQHLSGYRLLPRAVVHEDCNECSGVLLCGFWHRSEDRLLLPDYGSSSRHRISAM